MYVLGEKEMRHREDGSWPTYSYLKGMDGTGMYDFHF